MSESRGVSIQWSKNAYTMLNPRKPTLEISRAKTEKQIQYSRVLISPCREKKNPSVSTVKTSCHHS